MDFILSGERGLRAFEVKSAGSVRDADLKDPRAFQEDYPMATATLVYGEERSYHDDGFEVIPFGSALKELDRLL
ncbi:MAG: hypothetical protein JNJ88_08920 [Planctomycetes bacterium]|nr:hypothetical protein [Planctomycetota bacterium]